MCPWGDVPRGLITNRTMQFSFVTQVYIPASPHKLSSHIIIFHYKLLERDWIQKILGVLLAYQSQEDFVSHRQRNPMLLLLIFGATLNTCLPEAGSEYRAKIK